MVYCFQTHPGPWSNRWQPWEATTSKKYVLSFFIFTSRIISPSLTCQVHVDILIYIECIDLTSWNVSILILCFTLIMFFWSTSGQQIYLPLVFYVGSVVNLFGKVKWQKCPVSLLRMNAHPWIVSQIHIFTNATVLVIAFWSMKCNLNHQPSSCPGQWCLQRWSWTYGGGHNPKQIKFSNVNEQMNKCIKYVIQSANNRVCVTWFNQLRDRWYSFSKSLV